MLILWGCGALIVVYLVPPYLEGIGELMFGDLLNPPFQWWQLLLAPPIFFVAFMIPIVLSRIPELIRYVKFRFTK